MIASFSMKGLQHFGEHVHSFMNDSHLTRITLRYCRITARHSFDTKSGSLTACHAEVNGRRGFQVAGPVSKTLILNFKWLDATLKRKHSLLTL